MPSYSNRKIGRPALYTPGHRFGDLVLIDRYGNRGIFECLGKLQNGQVCGNIIELTLAAVVQGGKQDCGHVAAEQALSTYQRGHMLYNTWMHMIARCEDPANPAYPDYGGRGIKVCDRWHNFDTFASDLSSRPDGTTLDRKDNDGHYEPSNVRWATPREQALNKRRSATKKIDLSDIEI